MSVWQPVWPPGCSKENLLTGNGVSQQFLSASMTSPSKCRVAARNSGRSTAPSCPTFLHRFRPPYVESVCLLPVCTWSCRISKRIQPITSTEEVGWGIMMYKDNCFYRECYSKPFRRYQELYCIHKEAFDVNAVAGIRSNSQNVVNRFAFYPVLRKILARG